jgi:hypothetical protein
LAELEVLIEAALVALPYRHSVVLHEPLSKLPGNTCDPLLDPEKVPAVDAVTVTVTIGDVNEFPALSVVTARRSY